MKQELMDAILETPVIAAVKDDAGLRNALTNENIRVVFVLYGDICNISSIVRRIHEAGRFAVVHVDLIAELRAKIKACEDEMEACGAREVELDNEINSPEVYNDPDLLRQKSDELSDLRFHQEELFAAWEAAMEEQEAYEQTQQPEE